MMSRLIFFLVFIFVSGSFSVEDETIIVLKNKSDSFYKKYNRAKLELLFNQPKYAPGDTVQLLATYLYANNLKPVLGKQIAHICLFDQFGKKVFTQWASITNGTASVEMMIPVDFMPGNYLLVAFTDWMKNFDSSLFYKKQFVIAGKYAINEVSQKDTIIFNPEGGSLIEGLENNLAIRYNGKDRNIKIIVKKDGAELTTFNLIRDSVHVFRFVPELKSNCVAEISNGSNKQFAFPPSKSSGVSLQIDATQSEIKINTSVAGLTSVENLYIACLNNSGIVYHSHLDFAGTGRASLILPVTLAAGVMQLVLFDSKFNLLSDRVIYFSQSGKKEVDIERLQDIYSTRQVVNIDLKIKSDEQYQAPSFFSCRVIQDDLFSDNELRGIDYFTFQSDISNTFLLKEKQATQQTINNYLITQSCPWFSWKRIIENDRTPLFKPQEYLNFTGRATFTENGKNVPDSTQLIFFLEQSLLGYETYCNATGQFSFPLWLSITRPDRFFYSALLKGVDIDDFSVSTHDPDSSLSFFAKPWGIDKNTIDHYSIYSNQKQTINRSYSFFSRKAVLNDSINEPNKVIEEELNGADIVLNIKDYLMFPTMEEVVKEILKGVEYRKIKGRNVIRVYTTGKYTTYHAGPLFFIDGMVTRDPNYFLALKPADVIIIKVVRDSKKLFALGKLGANGVILVKTKLRSKIVKEKHVINFAGLSPESKNTFSKSIGTQMPDLRSCIFWYSKMGKDLKLVFTTSDDVGKFKIQVSGMTNDGVPFYFERPFQVKYAGN